MAWCCRGCHCLCICGRLSQPADHFWPIGTSGMIRASIPPSLSCCCLERAIGRNYPLSILGRVLWWWDRKDGRGCDWRQTPKSRSSCVCWSSNSSSRNCGSHKSNSLDGDLGWNLSRFFRRGERWCRNLRACWERQWRLSVVGLFTMLLFFTAHDLSEANFKPWKFYQWMLSFPLG